MSYRVSYNVKVLDDNSTSGRLTEKSSVFESFSEAVQFARELNRKFILCGNPLVEKITS